MRAALAACLLAACSSPQPRGPVTVHSNEGNADSFVVFQDPDGSARQTPIDDDGNAEGELVAGGSVIFVTGIGSRGLEMYTDVQPGAALEYGAPFTRPPVMASIPISAEIPSDADDVSFASSCGTGVVGTSGVVSLAASCAATDLVLVACSHPPFPLRPAPVIGPPPIECYQPTHYVRIPVTVGQTAQITIAAADWQALTTFSVALAGDDGVVSHALALSTAWGITADAGTAATTATAALPPVGAPTLTGSLQRATGQPQDFVARLPAGATSIDLRGVLAPWIVRHTPGWTVDDNGGALVADALITTFTWHGNALEVYGPAEATGDYVLPALPAAVADLIVEGPELMSVARLVRVEGADPAIDPQRLANIITSGGDPGGTSYAITAFAQP